MKANSKVRELLGELKRIKYTDGRDYRIERRKEDYRLCVKNKDDKKFIAAIENLCNKNNWYVDDYCTIEVRRKEDGGVVFSIDDME